MTKAVFTTKVTPSYKDLPELHYHFPHRYLDRAKQAVGDYIVYYEPRRSTSEASSSGGRQAYFAFARVTGIVEDKDLPDHYFARVADYQDFASIVPFSEGPMYYESALQKEDGSTNRGAFGSAVRLLPDNEFDLILKAGFSPIIGQAPAIPDVSSNEISEPGAPFERPIVEVTVSRPFRERSFMHNVRRRLRKSMCDNRTTADQRRRPPRGSGRAHPARGGEGARFGAEWPCAIRNGALDV